MTDRQRNALGILLSIALGLVGLSCRSCSGGEVSRARKVGRALAKPIRAQGRAQAGYPIAKSIEHSTHTAANVSSLATGLPIGLAYRVVRFIVRPALPQFATRR